MHIPPVTGRRRNYIPEQELYHAQRQTPSETRKEEDAKATNAPVLNQCQRCGRDFANAGRLRVHLRSCQPTQTSKTG